MDALIELFVTLKDLCTSLLNVLIALFFVVVPWLPLMAWIAFWMLAVNWVKAWDIIWRRGGIIGVVLLMVVAMMVWAAVAPPASGYHNILGLTVSNNVGKFVFVTTLTCIAFLCGAAQMSGFAGKLVDFSADDDAPAAH